MQATAGKARARTCSARARRPRRWWSTAASRWSASRSSSPTSRPSSPSRGSISKTCSSSPSCAGRGIGQALLTRLAELAAERGCGRFEWSVLDWNVNAIRFYERMGATVMPDWRICRIAGDTLAAYGAKRSDG
jgi:GNAT superfamily N-acetyltransferase